jgi:hypothetical protein
VEALRIPAQCPEQVGDRPLRGRHVNGPSFVEDP